MHGTNWLVVAATMVAAAPAAAQSVKLSAGEQIEFALTDRGSAQVRRAPATPTPFEISVGQKLSGVEPPPAPVAQGTPIYKSDGLPTAPQPTAGALRVRFLHVPDAAKSLLVIENGYPQALRYRAAITVDGEVRSTDVCVVMPGTAGVEFWPYAIEAVELSGFTTVPWQPGEPVPCE